MLKPAQLYKENLQEANIKSWYDPKNIYWHGGTSEYSINFDDNNGKTHAFVSVDKHDNVIGYISYSVDWESMSADGWGIISYDKGNYEFGKDVYQSIVDCFEKYNMNRISWYCWSDNPAIKGYRNFIRIHGGKECGYFRQVAKLRDGKLHDSVCFEIMADEFRRKEKI